MAENWPEACVFYTKIYLAIQAVILERGLQQIDHPPYRSDMALVGNGLTMELS